MLPAAVRTLGRTLALCAFFVVSTVLTACGGGVPGNAVATIGHTSITKAQFDHWLPILAKQQQQSTGQVAIVPDPPNYAKCIAAARKAIPPPPKGQAQPKTPDSTLKQQCVTTYQGLASTTLTFLVSAVWLEGEAKDLKLKVADSAIRTQYLSIVKQSYPNPADLKAFLTQSGLTIPDILFQLKSTTFRNKIQTKITSGSSKVTDAQVNAFYASHKSQFTKAESRDLLLVLTKTKGSAQAARSALESGQSFKSVVKKYSIDQRTKPTGGLLAGVVKGNEEKALDSAAFKASKSKLVGPIKGQFGYYVIEVKSIKKATTQSLASVTAQIRQQIVGERQSKAMTAFVAGYTKKWKNRTSCRKQFASATTASVCKNAPKAKATPTAPGQQQPQPQPQPQPSG